MNAARQKVESEGRCRVCLTGPARKLDAAHVVSRSECPGQGFDEPDGIVPLCSRRKGGAGCHEAYDAHRLDVLPYLRLEEQAAAVAKVGIVAAYQRTTGDAMPIQEEADTWSL